MFFCGAILFFWGIKTKQAPERLLRERAETRFNTGTTSRETPTGASGPVFVGDMAK